MSKIFFENNYISELFISLSWTKSVVTPIRCYGINISKSNPQ